MLLTITTTHKTATDLGYLLHKHPNRCQTTELSFGAAHVFYPIANDDKCTAALLLDVDPVGMIRGKRRPRRSLLLDQYVNDRPYVASSFLSVAIAETYGSALQGNCKKRPELVETIMALTAKIAVLPCRGGEKLLRRLFEPLGYEVSATGKTLDEKFPEWGDSSYFIVELQNNTTVVDIGCGEGNLLKLLLKEKQFDKIAGLDVSVRALEIAGENLYRAK